MNHRLPSEFNKTFCEGEAVRSGEVFLPCSQFWLATVQEVLHADWHDV